MKAAGLPGDRFHSIGSLVYSPDRPPAGDKYCEKFKLALLFLECMRSVRGWSGEAQDVEGSVLRG